MKSERLINALGQIDDELVLEVQPAAAVTKQKNRLPLWIMTAAMVALCFFGAYKLGISRQLPLEEPVTQDQPGQTAETEQTVSAEADAVRTYLQENIQRVTKDYQTDAHMVITDYFAENSSELKYLPSFDEETQPDWEALTLFAVMNCDHDGTMTQAQLEQTVARWMDVEVEHRSSSHLQYENGLYTVMARGLDAAPVCYSVEQIFEGIGGWYEMTVVGVGFWYEDLFEQTTEHSWNYRRLQEFYPDLTPENLQDRMYAYLRQHDAGGFLVTERFRIRFRLQEGDVPFRYLSCHRETIEVPTFTEADYQALREKIAAAPDPENVGDEAKEAFYHWLVANPDYLQTYLSYDFSFSFRTELTGEKTDALLHCKGPLRASDGDYQCFQYSYETQKVSFGPSGTWKQENYDPAEGVRRMLKQTTSADDYYLREAFARYFAANPEELEQLEGFGETDLVCYGLEECTLVDMSQDGSYYFTATLFGVRFTPEDLQSDARAYSYNGKKMLEQLTTVTAENFRELTLNQLLAYERPFFPYQINEKVRITFRLQEGESPFDYISWSREDASPVEVRLVDRALLDHVGNYSWLRIDHTEAAVEIMFLFNETVRNYQVVRIEGYEVKSMFSSFDGSIYPGSVQMITVDLSSGLAEWGISMVDGNGNTRTYAVMLVNGEPMLIDLDELNDENE